MAILRALSAAVLLALLVAAGGCNSTGRTPKIERALNDYMFGQYEPARQILEPLAAKTNEDFVLNNLRLGSVALADYDLDRAESAFYRAYEVMNSVHVNDPGRATGAVLISEKMKIWKGEPYERAMANFYLGLIYYMKKDYANARAAFENALFKLRDYGEGKVQEDKYQEVESDFTIAYVMLGKAWQKLDDPEKARFMFDRAGQLRPDLRRLADMSRQEQSNVLLVVDFGMGPEKIMHGDNSVVGFYPHPQQAGQIPIVHVNVDGKPADLRGLNRAPVDLLALAQERRWQSIDTIRVFKSIAGTGLMAAGAIQGARSHDRNDAATALALFGAGALLKATANADLRCWELLPRTVFLVPLRLPPGRHDVTVKVGRWTQIWRGIIAPPENEENTYYVRMNGLNDTGPYTWPPAALPTDAGSERISRGN